MSCPTAAATNDPHPLIDDYVLERIDVRVRELTAALALGEDDQDCLRQDMVVEILEAGRRFDAKLGDRNTFVEHVLAQFVRRTLRSELQRPDRETQTFSELDLDPVTNEARAGELDEQGMTEMRLDLESAIATLPKNLQTLCRRLMVLSPHEARISMRLTKEAYATAAERIAQHLQSHGVTEAFLVADRLPLL